MCEFIVEKGIVIDDEEAVLEGICNLSKKRISDIRVVSKFIQREKNTKFYFDEKLNCKMQDDGRSLYLWLDTGLRDTNGSAIFISLLKDGGKYHGYYYGTASELAQSVKDYFPRNRNIISNNIKGFRSKYRSKVQIRENEYISDENIYLLDCCNEGNVRGSMASLIATLNIEFHEEDIKDEADLEKVDPVVEEEAASPEEDEITIGLLMDKIDDMQGYVDVLLNKIEELEQRYQAKDADMEQLRKKNQEYKRAMVQMRTYLQNEEEQIQKQNGESDELDGHKLLGNKKILVIGATELGENIMQGIAKDYGFQKNDFEFVTDYSKVVGYAGRISSYGRYSAVILGCCPHKVKNLGTYSSLVEKLKQNDGILHAADARSNSGELKVTKDSFRKALFTVCQQMMACVA